MIFNPSQLNLAVARLTALIGSGKRVRIEVVSGKRSLNQNNYMHGVVFSVFAIHLGWTLDEAKQFFKRRFLSYEKDGETFVKETKKLTTIEAENFMEQCRQYAMIKEGCYIPLPNEVTDEMIAEIEKCNAYLK